MTLDITASLPINPEDEPFFEWLGAYVDGERPA
jgi:hypothetical protein